MDTLIDVNETSDVMCDIHIQEFSEYPGIIINTDGISPFKSSRMTIWPIIIAFSNLPPKICMNKNNLVVFSLWVGLCKSKMEIIFQPLVDLLQKLSHSGIVVDTPLGNQIFSHSWNFLFSSESTRT